MLVAWGGGWLCVCKGIGAPSYDNGLQALSRHVLLLLGAPTACGFGNTAETLIRDVHPNVQAFPGITQKDGFKSEG